MHIIIVVVHYIPIFETIAARMLHELAVESVKNGHEVTVITPSHKLKKKYEYKKLDNVQIYYFKSGRLRRTKPLYRLYNEIMLSFRAWRSLRKELKKIKCDYIIYYSPTIFFGLLIKKLKKLYGCPSFLILRDFFPQWIVDNGTIKRNSIIHNFFLYFERINYRSADIIGIQSPKNIKWYKANQSYHNFIKTKLLYNWASLEEPVTGSNFRTQYNLLDKIIFIYGGNIGYAQDMLNIVRLANNIKSYEEAHFVIIGDGDEFNLIQYKIHDLNLDNILLLKSVPQDIYQRILSEADVGLFSLSKDHTTHNFPGKLLSYMSHSLPILGSVNPGNDIIDVINEKSGFISINGDDEVFLENALLLLKKLSLRDKMGLQSKETLKNQFSVATAFDSIMKSREQVISLTKDN
jgi:glycosyltransferase involved in cell wall biosynthesis